MDKDKSVIEVANLSMSNYDIWKRANEVVLSQREVDEIVDQLSPFSPIYDHVAHKKWDQTDKQARVIMDLLLSDYMLKKVGACTSSNSMLDEMNNVFRRRTLPNKMCLFREIHAVEMKAGEGILSFINRVEKVGSILRYMDANLDEREIAMTNLCRVSPAYEALVNTLDGLSAESAVFNLELFERRLLQAEKRHQQRQTINADATALINTSKRRRQFKSGAAGLHIQWTSWTWRPELLERTSFYDTPKSLCS